MSKPLSNPSGPSPARGFSLIELLLAMALSLVVLALTFTLVQELQNTADLANTSADVNENLRAAVIMMTRDLSTAGENMPGGSIALPYTPGNPSPTPSITLPTPAYPAATPFPTPYPAGASLYWPVVAAGYAAGPTQGSGANAITTDIVTIIGVDQTSSFNNTAASAPTLPASPTGSATITVSPTAAGYVTPGQLIKLTNTNGSCLLAVSTVNTTTGVITFAHGDAHDYLGVNQFSILLTSDTATAGPSSGTMSQLQTATKSPTTGLYSFSWPTTLTADPISMVTYYLDTATPRNLQKLVTSPPATLPPVPQPVALGINVMQIRYVLTQTSALGVISLTIPAVGNPWPSVANPNYSPTYIRRAVLTMIGESDHQNHANKQWYSKEVVSSVAVQNLDYYNKYDTGSSMTPN